MEKHVFELVCGLIDRGIDVHIICEDKSFLPDPNLELADRVIGIDPNSLREQKWTERYLEKAARFAEVLDAEQYDIVHCHNQYGYRVVDRLADTSGRPGLVSTFHLTPPGALERFAALGVPESEGAPIDRAVAGMERTVARGSDRCIAVSRTVGQEIERFYGVGRDRIQVIYNWYNPAIFYPYDRTTARQVLGMDPNARYLLYIGHFGLHRGQFLAAALRLLPADIRMVVIHPEADEQIRAEFGERIVFAGYVPGEQMALYYSSADLQCFPTVYAGFGLALVEGMACGCPAVVCNYGAMNEIVTTESGYLVDEPTSTAYAAQIMAGLQQGDRKRSAAIERSRTFRMQRGIDAVVDVYQRVLAAGPATEPYQRKSAVKAERSGT